MKSLRWFFFTIFHSSIGLRKSEGNSRKSFRWGSFCLSAWWNFFSANCAFKTWMEFQKFFPSRLPFTDFTESLRLTEVRIPNHVIRNNSVRLECHFDLNGEALYSVKWYKDGYEFYRYVPRDHPPAQVFDQNGITVDVSCPLHILKCALILILPSNSCTTRVTLRSCWTT